MYLNKLNLIPSNPVSKLHTECSCLPTWKFCDHFIPKETKRTQEAEELTLHSLEELLQATDLASQF